MAVDSPEQLLGMTDQDPALADYVFANDCYMDQGGALGWICPDLGVTILMDFNSRVTTVSLGPDYRGGVTGGIAFGDSQEAVVQKLGEPDAVSGDTELVYRLADDVTLTVKFPGVVEEGYLGHALPDEVQRVSYALVQ